MTKNETFLLNASNSARKTLKKNIQLVRNMGLPPAEIDMLEDKLIAVAIERQEGIRYYRSQERERQLHERQISNFQR